jgi:DNA-directed RNA polymerase specialized sigma24 family protein
MDEKSSSSHWDDYLTLQQRLDCQRVDHRAWATEEQLNEFLDAAAGNQLPQSPESRSKWLDNLATNRRKKHRRRLTLLRDDIAFVYGGPQPDDPFDLAARNDCVSQMRSQTTTDEWRILWARACGDSYEEIALREQLSVAALKSKISRCRKRLRNCA